jgi:hypothetical protein
MRIWTVYDELTTDVLDEFQAPPDPVNQENSEEGFMALLQENMTKSLAGDELDQETILETLKSNTENTAEKVMEVYHSQRNSKTPSRRP